MKQGINKYGGKLGLAASNSSAVAYKQRRRKREQKRGTGGFLTEV